MSNKELQNKNLQNEDLENVSGGRTEVFYAYDQDGEEYISDIILAEGASRFLKDRDYAVKNDGDNIVVSGSEDKKVVLDLLKKKGFNIVENYPSMKREL